MKDHYRFVNTFPCETFTFKFKKKGIKLMDPIVCSKNHHEIKFEFVKVN